MKTLALSLVLCAAALAGPGRIINIPNGDQLFGPTTKFVISGGAVPLYKIQLSQVGNYQQDLASVTISSTTWTYDFSPTFSTPSVHKVYVTLWSKVCSACGLQPTWAGYYNIAMSSAMPALLMSPADGSRLTTTINTPIQFTQSTYLPVVIYAGSYDGAADLGQVTCYSSPCYINLPDSTSVPVIYIRLASDTGMRDPQGQKVYADELYTFLPKVN